MSAAGKGNLYPSTEPSGPFGRDPPSFVGVAPAEIFSRSPRWHCLVLFQSSVGACQNKTVSGAGHDCSSLPIKGIPRDGICWKLDAILIGFEDSNKPAQQYFDVVHLA
eukprot:scaffold7976_cov403-Prasinococcus_capsulatus_cf.AAC.9